MKGKKKTNAARILDTLGISYEIKEYEVDEDDLSAVHVAQSVGMPIEMVFKTLVARGDKNGILMAVIPGAAELDLKALATASGNKRVEMVHLKEVFALTGYIRGGCSPLGAKKAYPVYLDRHAEAQTTIAVSAGKRGEQLLLAPADLVRATRATVAEIVR
ncbi:MAG: Cys-tRNA(Pro) deacylase [Selenomonadaceae bacterium]|nr:Cys-tRNA(Pro) deacylase [Selenomonadaceae bacterium]